MNPVRELFEVGLRLSRSSAEQLIMQQGIEAKETENSDIQSILQPLSRITLKDLGVSASYFESGLITYVTVFSSPEFWMGFFCMNSGTRFPLHDHPQMMGFSRLMSGRVSYLGLNVQGRRDDGCLMSQVVSECETTAPRTELLTGNMNNIHEIEAREDSLLFDLFLPYYNETRQCKFFRELERREESVVLIETPQPVIPCREKGYRGTAVR